MRSLSGNILVFTLLLQSSCVCADATTTPNQAPGSLASTEEAPQAWIHFATWVPGKVYARVWDPDTATPISGTYVAQLYLGASADSLVPAGIPVSFGTGAMAGYVDGGAVSIPKGIVTPPFAQVRAWDGKFGSTYESALASGAPFGASRIVRTTESETDLVGLTDFICGREIPSSCMGPDPTFHTPIVSCGDLIFLWSPAYASLVEESDSPLGPWVLSTSERTAFLVMPIATGKKFYRLYNPGFCWIFP